MLVSVHSSTGLTVLVSRRSIDRVQECYVVDRLSEERERPLLARLRSRAFIVESRDEYDRGAYAGLHELLLKLQAGHSGHMNID